MPHGDHERRPARALETAIGMVAALILLEALSSPVPSSTDEGRAVVSTSVERATPATIRLHRTNEPSGLIPDDWLEDDGDLDRHGMVAVDASTPAWAPLWAADGAPAQAGLVARFEPLRDPDWDQALDMLDDLAATGGTRPAPGPVLLEGTGCCCGGSGYVRAVVFSPSCHPQRP